MWCHMPVAVSRGSGLCDHADRAALGSLVGVHRSRHDPDRLLMNLAVAVADGAEAICDIAVRADLAELFGFGVQASDSTYWRNLNAMGPAPLAAVHRAWAAAVREVAVQTLDWDRADPVAASRVPGSRPVTTSGTAPPRYSPPWRWPPAGSSKPASAAPPSGGPAVKTFIPEGALWGSDLWPPSRTAARTATALTHHYSHRVWPAGCRGDSGSP